MPDKSEKTKVVFWCRKVERIRVCLPCAGIVLEQQNIGSSKEVIFSVQRSTHVFNSPKDKEKVCSWFRYSQERMFAFFIIEVKFFACMREPPFLNHDYSIFRINLTWSRESLRLSSLFLSIFFVWGRFS